MQMKEFTDVEEKVAIEPEMGYFDNEFADKDPLYWNGQGYWVESAYDSFEFEVPEEIKNQLFSEEATTEIIETTVKNSLNALA